MTQIINFYKPQKTEIMEHSKNWRLVERLNFNENLAAWQEHRIKDNASCKDVETFFKKNKDRILFAYIPHYSGGGMADIMFNKNYVHSVHKENSCVKLID